MTHPLSRDIEIQPARSSFVTGNSNSANLGNRRVEPHRYQAHEKCD